MKPTFSVIIPLYNKEKYIQKAIESVLKQSFSDFELLIIDDGSTDNSFEKVKVIEDSRIVLIQQENAGVSHTRNKGVDLAQSDLIAFLDADDWWEETFLEKMNELISNFPQAAVYASSYFKVKNKQKIPAQIGVDSDFKRGYINYFEVYANTFWVPVNCSFVVVRKDVFLSEKGFKVNLKFGEDFDLWLRLALKHQFAFVNENLAFSNQDVDFETRAMGDRLWEKEEHVLFNLDYISQLELENPKLKYLIDGLKVRSLHYFYRKGHYKKEVNELLSQVNFAQQAKIYYFYYKFPFWITELYFRYKLLGSKIKKWIFNMR